MTSAGLHIERVLTLLEGKNLRVKLVPKRPKGKWGLCDKKKREIKICKKLDVRTRVFVLIRECLSLLHPKKDGKWIKAKAYSARGFLTAEEYQKIENFLERLS